MQVVSNRSKDPLAPSRFWQSTGSPTTINPVDLSSSEGQALQKYFYRHMPHDAYLRGISRVENRQNWRMYKLYRNELYEQILLEDDMIDGIEMYLWHGSRDVEATVHEGFSIAYSSLEFNKYGAGLYFAVDPRLSHHFFRQARDNPFRVCELILARVAVGWCAEKSPLRSHVPECRKRNGPCTWKKCQDMRMRELRKPANRTAPDGYHSCTSKESIEVVVYKDVQAYPAYTFEYVCASLVGFDPYDGVARLGYLRWDHRSDCMVNFEASRMNKTRHLERHFDGRQFCYNESDSDKDSSCNTKFDSSDEDADYQLFDCIDFTVFDESFDLIKKGRDHQLNFLTCEPFSVLHWAAYNSCPVFGRTLCHVLLCHPHFQMVGTVSKTGITALHIAAFRGYASVCRQMLPRLHKKIINERANPRRGIDDMLDQNQFVCHDGDTALDIAYREGHHDIVEMLKESLRNRGDDGWVAYNPFQVYDEHHCVLLDSADDGQEDECLQLITFGHPAQLNFLTPDGRSVLHYAAESNLDVVCHALLCHPLFEMQCQISDFGITALHIAAWAGLIEVCAHMLTRVSKSYVMHEAWACEGPEFMCQLGDTASIIAYRHGHQDIVAIIDAFMAS